MVARARIYVKIDESFTSWTLLRPSSQRISGRFSFIETDLD